MNLATFIDTFKDSIAQRVVESYPPLYRPSENAYPLPKLLRSPLGAQADAIRGAALSLKAHQGTIGGGEMGTGKTFIAASAAHAAGFKKVLVLCPPHLVRKWKREVEETVPGTRAAIVNSITDLERLRLFSGSAPLFAVMSRERAKLSFRWQPAIIERWAVADGRLVRDEQTGDPIRVPCCPACHGQIVDKEGVPLTSEDLSRKRRVCDDCNSPLWQADASGPRRYPLADYVKHRMKGFFDLFIGDEVHEFKARGSAQGIAAGVLAESCGRSLTLSGTLMGGYASTLFHLLYRFSPEIRSEFRHAEEGRWIERYGFTEHTIYGQGDDLSVEDGRNSRRRRYRKVVRERPGLAPSALFHLIGNSIFLRLSDVASGLPAYEEQVLLSGMDSEPDHTGFSQRSAYNTVYEALKKALADALATGSKRLLATYLQTMLAYPDGCTRGETVFDPTTGVPIVGVPPLSEERLYPKEQSLLDLVAAERLAGRRVLVYATHTGTRDITERMDGILTRHGFRVAVMKADAVAPERREAWVADRVKEGVDILICHPRLVQTGLDLIDFPTICWYETDYSVYTMRQASRRSWRIGRGGISGGKSMSAEFRQRHMRVIELNENDVVSQIRMNHGRELEVVDAALDQILQGLDAFAYVKQRPDSRLEDAQMFLAVRSFNSLHIARQLLEHGYYQQASALARMAMEDQLVAEDAETHPPTLDALLDDKGSISSGDLTYGKMAERISPEAKKGVG